MATSTRRRRHVRALVALGLLMAALAASLIAGNRWSDASWAPQLALDLEGGTQVILTPVAEDDSEITPETIQQAIEIIRQRVDASGVAEAEITSQGGTNIVVALPGNPSDETLDLVRESAQMLFRPVIVQAGPLPIDPDAALPEDGTGPLAPVDPAAPEATATPEDPAATEAPADPETPASPEETPAAGGSGVPGAAPAEAEATEAPADPEAPATEAPPDPEAPATEAPAEPTEPAEPADGSDFAWLDDALLEQFNALDCTDPANLTGGTDLVGDPDAAVVACDQSGASKYVLGPVEVAGEDVESATSGLRVTQTGIQTNEWVVNIQFDGEGTRLFRDVTTRLLSLEAPRNQFAMVLDGLVISAPSVNSVIPDGGAEISGSFDRDSAATLARQLNFGALPLTFEVLSEQEISATLGTEQLEKGLLAGVIGLALVAVYSLLQYRALGAVTIASLIIAAGLTYLLIAFLSWNQGYRLSLPGVAGLIVAIGVTADSFIVYFERVRDELRDGRTLSAAVEEGWRRARRTILASDAVSFLAAVVLYFLAVGGVRGFAFTLGLTTLVDLVVVFLFTHPVLALLARTRFFAEGHVLSGLDPRLLGGRSRYVGRGRVVRPGERADRTTGGDEDDDVVDLEKEGARETVGAGTGSTAIGGRTTIAERRAAERRAAAARADASTDGKDA